MTCGYHQRQHNINIPLAPAQSKDPVGLHLKPFTCLFIPFFFFNVDIFAQQLQTVKDYIEAGSRGLDITALATPKLSKSSFRHGIIMDILPDTQYRAPSAWGTSISRDVFLNDFGGRDVFIDSQLPRKPRLRPAARWRYQRSEIRALKPDKIWCGSNGTICTLALPELIHP
jgi:hypothetical protein